MIILLTIIHVIVCLFLIIVVLLQSGKAADLAGAFGGMGSQTAFGPRGAATILSKATTVAAGLFMITSLSLSILSTRSTGGGSTVLETHAPKQEQKKTGGTMTLTPEGVDPSKGITIPIPSAEELKKAGAIGVPKEVKGAEAPVEQKAPAKSAPEAPKKK
jgi:preprotein translocase subunit SecG